MLVVAAHFDCRLFIGHLFSPFMTVNVIYYLDVTSSWCYWAEPAWAELKEQYATKPVEFRWRIALLDETALPVSKAQLEWFYRRGGLGRKPAAKTNLRSSGACLRTDFSTRRIRERNSSSTRCVL